MSVPPPQKPSSKTRRIRILGQEVRVYNNGIVWIDPDTRQHFMIGETRKEAEASLREWQVQRLGAFAPRTIVSRETLPKLEDGTRVGREYWRAFYYARSRAKRSGMPIMSREEYVAIVRRANGECEVSGLPFSIKKLPGHRKAMWAPSIDRIECGRGYEADNCRLVCVAVNLALNEFGADVLIKIALAIGARPIPQAAGA
jgi:hypothetical protein